MAIELPERAIWIHERMKQIESQQDTLRDEYHKLDQEMRDLVFSAIAGERKEGGNA